MNISLTPELETLVMKKVESGMYHSASEVIREGLRLLKEQDALREIRREELRSEVRRGFEQIERGEYTEYASGDELTQAVLTEGRKRAAEQKKVRA